MLSMYDLRKIARGEPLNEFVIAFPSSKKEVQELKQSTKFKNKRIEYSIQIRTQFGSDAGTDGKRVSHECAVKIYQGDTVLINIPIPTKPYSTLSNSSIYKKQLELLDKSDITRDAKTAIKSFIYQHQMDLIAYWYLTEEELRNLDLIFREYFRNLLSENNYSRSPYKRTEGKTAAELEQDKKEILNYVKSKAPSYSGSLYFGA